MLKTGYFQDTRAGFNAFREAFLSCSMSVLLALFSCVFFQQIIPDNIDEVAANA